jgi:hypothetical protein
LVEGLCQLGHATSTARRPIIWFGIRRDETAGQVHFTRALRPKSPENETARPGMGRAACDFLKWRVWAQISKYMQNSYG